MNTQNVKKICFTIFSLVVFFSNPAFANYMSAEEYNQRVIDLRHSGNHYLATKTALEFAQKYPNDGNAYVALGVLSYPENIDVTISHLNKALQLGNIDAETKAVIKNLLGTCYYEIQNYDKALMILNSITTDEFCLLHNNEKYQYYATKTFCYAMINPKQDDKIILYATKALEYENTPLMYFYRGMARTASDKQQAREDFAIQKYLCTTESKFKDTLGCLFFPELY